MATQININVKECGEKKDVKIVVLEGEIDESNLREFEDKLNPFLDDENTNTIVLNLKSLSYINSKVIGYMAGFYTKLSEKNKKMIFAEANQNIMDILSLVGLTTIIEHYPTEKEAINSCLT